MLLIIHLQLKLYLEVYVLFFSNWHCHFRAKLPNSLEIRSVQLPICPALIKMRSNGSGMVLECLWLWC
jgi:hypothetical protein